MMQPFLRLGKDYGKMAKTNLHQCLIILNILLMLFSTNQVLCEHLDHQQKPKSKHFVLVHGSCLGAWSWYKLLPVLKSSGYKVSTVDLAASGIDSLQPNDLRSMVEYFQPLTDLMAALPLNHKVILVGHSLGGLAISYAMQHFPEKILVSVFVTAQMPGPALNISTLSQEVTYLKLVTVCLVIKTKGVQRGGAAQTLSGQGRGSC